MKSPSYIALLDVVLNCFESDPDHGAIRVQYPRLFSFLSKDQNTRCPDCISLGPEGSFFISIAGRKSLQCPPNSELNFSLEEIKRLWWGFGGSYIAELQDGSWGGDLRNYYDGLGSLIWRTDNGVKVSKPHPLHCYVLVIHTELGNAGPGFEYHG